MLVSTSPTNQLRRIAYYNGAIYTGDPSRPRTEAMGLIDERVCALGTMQEVMAIVGDDAETVDLGGRSVVPGPADVHTHTAAGALQTLTVECRDFFDPSMVSIPVMMEAMSKAAAAAPPGAWVIGTGAPMQSGRLAEGRFPNREDLDRAVPDHPAYIQFGAHVASANSAALAAGRVDAHTRDPSGGRIERRPDGEPSGVLYEHAFFLVQQKLSDLYTPDVFVEALEMSLRAAASRGVTCIHEIVSSPEEIRAYQKLEQTGRLPIRVCLIARVVNADFDVDALAKLGLRTGFGSDMLWFGGGKISIDGGFTGRGSAFTATIDGKPIFDNPLIRVDQDTLNRAIAINHQAGIRMCIHAIGDFAVDMALTAFELAGVRGSDMRHRIEHFGNWMCTPDRLDKCSELGLTPVPNIPFLRYLGSEVWDMLGGPRNYADGAFPLRTLADAGFRFASGSDGPWYYPLDALRDVATMMSRRSRDGVQYSGSEQLTATQALRAQTMNAAWLGYRENSIGSLSVGKYADFVVYDSDNLISAPAEDLFGAQVDRTVVGGAVVYSGR